MTTWGRRKDNKLAYPKNPPKGVRGIGTITSPISDIHLKEQRLRSDSRYGWVLSNHMFNLDDIEYGRFPILNKLETIFQRNHPKYSLVTELNRQDERVRDGVLEVLGRDADKIEPFIDYRLSNQPNDISPKWIMAVPLYGNDGSDHYLSEDGLAGMFQTEGYKHKLRITTVDPRKFLNEWVPPKSGRDGMEGYNRKVIEAIKQSLRDGKPVETPFISVDEKTGEVTSHEGRHRANAAIELGIREIPVWVTSSNSIDNMTEEERNRFFSDEYIRQTY